MPRILVQVGLDRGRNPHNGWNGWHRNSFHAIVGGLAILMDVVKLPFQFGGSGSHLVRGQDDEHLQLDYLNDFQDELRALLVAADFLEPLERMLSDSGRESRYRKKIAAVRTNLSDFRLNLNDVLYHLLRLGVFLADRLDIEEDVGDGPRKIHNCTSIIREFLEPFVSAKEPHNHLHEQAAQGPDIVGPGDCAILNITFGRPIARRRRDGFIWNVGSAALAIE